MERPWGFQEIESPRFQDNRHMEVVGLLTLHTGWLYPPWNIPGTHFCYRLSQPKGHSAAGRIVSMKNSNDTLGNRTHDLPACSAVPQLNVPPHAPNISGRCMKYEYGTLIEWYELGKPTNWETKLSQYHSVHHKSQNPNVLYEVCGITP